MDIQYGGLIGLYGGMLFAIIAWYFDRRKAAKAGGKDEVQDHIFKTARSFSWYATIGTIYILFTLHGIGIDLSIAPTLGILMLVQLSSWGIGAAILSYYYSIDKVPNVSLISGIAIIGVPAILFTVLAILMENWILLLCPIPLGVVGIFIIKQGSSTGDGGN